MTQCNFRVGQKVVLVEGFIPSEIERAQKDGVSLPAEGKVYTVRKVQPSTKYLDGCGLVLHEITNAPHWSDGLEPSFQAEMFRPVVERKTDISVFKALLTPSKEKVETAS